MTHVSFYADPNNASNPHDPPGFNQVVEGNDFVFHFHRDVTTDALDVHYQFGGVPPTATPGTDFTADGASMVVHFAANQSDADLTLHIMDDGSVEGRNLLSCSSILQPMAPTFSTTARRALPPIMPRVAQTTPRSTSPNPGPSRLRVQIPQTEGPLRRAFHYRLREGLRATTFDVRSSGPADLALSADHFRL